MAWIAWNSTCIAWGDSPSIKNLSESQGGWCYDKNPDRSGWDQNHPC